MAEISLIGSFNARGPFLDDFTTVKDQIFTNYIPVISDTTKERFLEKRPGYTAVGQSGGNGGTNSYCKALKWWKGNSAAGNQLVTVFSGDDNDNTFSFKLMQGDETAFTYTATGTSGTKYHLTETTVAGVPTVCMASSGGYYYQAGGALTAISDTHFPSATPAETLTGPFAHLAGFNFILTTRGRLWNSDLNSIINWTADSYVDALTVPGAGVAAYSHGEYVIAIKQGSIEYFYNAGNPTGSPLKPVLNNTKDVGCPNPDAICQTPDSIYFLGASSSGGGLLGIYQLKGSNVTRISDPFVERVIAGSLNLTGTNAGRVSLTTARMNGQPLLFITIIGAVNTRIIGFALEMPAWFYVIAAQTWFRMDSDPITGNVYIGTKSSTSVAYKLLRNTQVYQDNSATITATAQLAKFDGGTGKRKDMPRLILRGDMTASSTVACSISDDDYGQFDSVGTFDMSLSSPTITRLGSFRERAIKLVHTANTANRLRGLDAEDMRVLSS